MHKISLICDKRYSGGNYISSSVYSIANTGSSSLALCVPVAHYIPSSLIAGGGSLSPPGEEHLIQLNSIDSLPEEHIKDVFVSMTGTTIACVAHLHGNGSS